MDLCIWCFHSIQTLELQDGTDGSQFHSLRKWSQMVIIINRIILIQMLRFTHRSNNQSHLSGQQTGKQNKSLKKWPRYSFYLYEIIIRHTNLYQEKLYTTALQHQVRKLRSGNKRVTKTLKQPIFLMTAVQFYIWYDVNYVKIRHRTKG